MMDVNGSIPEGRARLGIILVRSFLVNRPCCLTGCREQSLEILLPKKFLNVAVSFLPNHWFITTMIFARPEWCQVCKTGPKCQISRSIFNTWPLFKRLHRSVKAAMVRPPTVSRPRNSRERLRLPRLTRARMAHQISLVHL